jgi:hypothetical protein
MMCGVRAYIEAQSRGCDTGGDGVTCVIGGEGQIRVSSLDVDLCVSRQPWAVPIKEVIHQTLKGGIRADV